LLGPTGIRKSRDYSILKECALKVLTIYRIYGFNDKTYDVTKTVEQWATNAADCGWMKFMKYKLSAFFSAVNDQDLPKRPFTNPDKATTLLGGSAWRWLRNSLKGWDEMRKLSFSHSINQAKKGLPRPSDEQAEQAIKDTVKDLTRKEIEKIPHQLFTNWHEAQDVHPEIELEMSKAAFLGQLRRTVKELFGSVVRYGPRGQKVVKPNKERFSMEERLKMFFPSTSANYINSRKRGGAVGTILGDEELLEGLKEKGGLLRFYGEQKYNKQGTLEEKEDEERIEQEMPKVMIYDNSKLKEGFKELWWRLLRRAREEEQLVKPVSLKEALKIRVITKGPPYTQTVLRPLWKKLHTVLRNHPTFRLIGGYVSEQIIQETFGKELKEDEIFHSGDFRAATNLLYSWCSEATAGYICDEMNLTTYDRKLFAQNLVGNIIEINGEFFVQTQGQLMGSITSFPVLCIVNATMSRWGMEIAENKVMRLDQCRLLVNGDDEAAKTNYQYPSIWEKIIAIAGMESSVGKTFVSRRFVQINSTNFMFGEHNEEEWWRDVNGEPFKSQKKYKEVKYVNIGLLYGMKRSEGHSGMRDLDDQYGSIGSKARELIRGCPADLQGKCLQLFLRENHDMLESTHLPWYIPEWLGGLGLPEVNEHKASKLDRRIAQTILREHQMPIQLRNAQPWKLRQRAEESLPKPLYYAKKCAETELFDRIVNDAVVNLLFNSDITIDDIYDDVDEGNVKWAVRHNSRLYEPRRWKTKMNKEIKDENLELKPLYKGYPLESSLKEERIEQTGPWQESILD
jgi:hypothetical protein